MIFNFELTKMTIGLITRYLLIHSLRLTFASPWIEIAVIWKMTSFGCTDMWLNMLVARFSGLKRPKPRFISIFMICNHGLLFRDLSRSFLPHQHSKITASFWYGQFKKIRPCRKACLRKSYTSEYIFGEINSKPLLNMSLKMLYLELHEYIYQSWV